MKKDLSQRSHDTVPLRDILEERGGMCVGLDDQYPSLPVQSCQLHLPHEVSGKLPKKNVKLTFRG
jgi:hypothetical protein